MSVHHGEVSDFSLLAISSELNLSPNYCAVGQFVLFHRGDRSLLQSVISTGSSAFIPPFSDHMNDSSISVCAQQGGTPVRSRGKETQPYYVFVEQDK